MDAFKSSRVIRINEGSTSVGLSRGNSSISSTWEGAMSSVNRIFLVFRLWRIRQSDELCEVVLWNEHQGVLVFVLGVGF